LAGAAKGDGPSFRAEGGSIRWRKESALSRRAAYPQVMKARREQQPSKPAATYQI
jgi:hypothetical protein